MSFLSEFYHLVNLKMSISFCPISSSQAILKMGDSITSCANNISRTFRALLSVLPNSYLGLVVDVGSTLQ